MRNAAQTRKEVGAGHGNLIEDREVHPGGGLTCGLMDVLLVNECLKTDHRIPAHHSITTLTCSERMA